MAAGAGMTAQATTIFNGLKAARPDSELPYIGLAVASMNAGQYDEALEFLTEKAMKLNPDSCLAAAFAGLALRLAGRSDEARRELEKVVSRCGQDEAAVNMAKALLED